MQATHTSLLDHHNIPLEARQCHIFPDMGAKALLSIAQFVDHGYKAVLKPTSISLIHETNPDLSFEGGRDPNTRMWTIDLHHLPQRTTQQPHMQINSVCQLSLKKDIIKYLHRAAGSPTTATWCAAIANGNYATWPGLTANDVRKYLPKSIATAKGHMRQIRKHTRSTKLPQSPETPSSPRAMTTTAQQGNVQHNMVTIQCMPVSGKLFTDQTCRFPTRSSRGM